MRRHEVNGLSEFSEFLLRVRRRHSSVSASTDEVFRAETLHMGSVDDQIYCQSAVVPFRLSGAADIEVLLITSRSGKRWIVPKGFIDPGETAVEAAAREALEEAGIEGEITDISLGTYSYRKWGGRCDVVVYAMKVLA